MQYLKFKAFMMQDTLTYTINVLVRYSYLFRKLRSKFL